MQIHSDPKQRKKFIQSRSDPTLRRRNESKGIKKRKEGETKRRQGRKEETHSPHVDVRGRGWRESMIQSLSDADEGSTESARWSNTKAAVSELLKHQYSIPSLHEAKRVHTTTRSAPVGIRRLARLTWTALELISWTIRQLVCSTLLLLHRTRYTRHTRRRRTPRRRWRRRLSSLMKRCKARWGTTTVWRVSSSVVMGESTLMIGAGRHER
jgi:hypothetical protein